MVWLNLETVTVIAVVFVYSHIHSSWKLNIIFAQFDESLVEKCNTILRGKDIKWKPNLTWFLFAICFCFHRHIRPKNAHNTNGRWTIFKLNYFSLEWSYSTKMYFSMSSRVPVTQYNIVTFTYSICYTCI